MLLGKNDDGTAVDLPSETLLRHVVVLGASGSGKTVACKVLVEEAIRQGISVIAIDPQGDLASLALPMDRAESAKRGVADGVWAGYQDKVDVKIWTPGSTYGLPLCISPIAEVRASARPEDKLKAYSAIASSLAGLVRDDSQETVAAFSCILEWADNHGPRPGYKYHIDTLTDFADWLLHTPPELDAKLSSILPKGARKKAECRLRAMTMGASRLMFDLGQPIDIGTLLGREPGGPVSKGKARVSVVYLNTLSSQEEKEFFVAALANAMYSWMLANPSPGKPQGVFYLDEAAPFLPPVRKPSSKEPLMLLLRQARKYGISCQIATQSPGDLDYKGLAQVGTWLLGRMTTYQEAAKVESVLRAMPGVDADSIMESLPGLSRGRFIMASPDTYPAPFPFQVRQLVTQHHTLTESAIEPLISAADREEFAA